MLCSTIPLVACRVERADSIARGSSEAGLSLCSKQEAVIKANPAQSTARVFLQPKVRPESPLLICHCDLRKRELWGAGWSASFLPQALATWTVRLDSTAELKMRVTNVCTILSSRCPNSAAVQVQTLHPCEGQSSIRHSPEKQLPCQQTKIVWQGLSGVVEQ